ncbi:hypothetical protein [Flavobacterium sp. UBA6046]|uniref:hypothetical protein n=1 Tax=Flavobacterium sp. UBA6046 TaxID=1946552 RepID=UPI0025C21875|nr:hypothetical protein [Flavobacterium sp. UBA6046]
MKPIVINLSIKSIITHQDDTHNDIQNRMIEVLRSAIQDQSFEPSKESAPGISTQKTIQVLEKERGRALARLREVSLRLTQPRNRRIAQTFEKEYLRKVLQASENLLTVEDALEEIRRIQHN